MFVFLTDFLWFCISNWLKRADRLPPDLHHATHQARSVKHRAGQKERALYPSMSEGYQPAGWRRSQAPTTTAPEATSASSLEHCPSCKNSHPSTSGQLLVSWSTYTHITSMKHPSSERADDTFCDGERKTAPGQLSVPKRPAGPDARLPLLLLIVSTSGGPRSGSRKAASSTSWVSNPGPALADRPCQASGSETEARRRWRVRDMSHGAQK